VEETLKAFEDQEETVSTIAPLMHIEDHYKGFHPGISRVPFNSIVS
jgi:hypothetical protein